MMNAYRDPWLEAKRRVDLMEQEVRTTGDEIHIHEGTATYDPDAPASVFERPNLDQQCWIGDA